jgi:hypothetical protein
MKAAILWSVLAVPLVVGLAGCSAAADACLRSSVNEEAFKHSDEPLPPTQKAAVPPSH